MPVAAITSDRHLPIMMALGTRMRCGTVCGQVSIIHTLFPTRQCGYLNNDGAVTATGMRDACSTSAHPKQGAPKSPEYLPKLSSKARRGDTNTEQRPRSASGLPQSPGRGSGYYDPGLSEQPGPGWAQALSCGHWTLDMTLEHPAYHGSPPFSLCFRVISGPYRSSDPPIVTDSLAGSVAGGCA